MTIDVFPGSIPDLGIEIDTPAWFAWLSLQQHFKYVGNCTQMSVKRRNNGKWYARKKVYSSSGGSKPVDLYIGGDSECTADKLKELNYQFSRDWTEFWEWYYSPARREGKSKGVQSREISTLAELTSQTQEEIAQLRAELERLKQRESYLLDQHGLLKSQLVHEAQQENERLKKQNTELDNANWECEKRVTTYSEMHRKSELKQKELQSLVDNYQTLLAESSAIAKLSSYLDEIGGIPIDEKGKPKPRYDQLAKFKAWLENCQNSNA